MKLFEKLSVIVVLILFVSGCSTVTKKGMLDYEPSKKDITIDEVKFALIVNKGTPTNITDKAKSNYPNIFSNDFTSLPLWVDLECNRKYQSSDDLAFSLIATFTLLTIPVPLLEERDSCKGSILLEGLKEPVINKQISYYFETTDWFPGIWFFLIPIFNNSEKFNDTNTIIEYAVQSLKEADPKTLTEMYIYRKQRLKKVFINGEPYWVFIGFKKSQKAKNEGYDLATILFWKNYPKLLEEPLESVVAAINENGKWQPVKSIPRKLGLKSLTLVSVKIENNKPIDVEIIENVKPKVSYFIKLENYYDPEEIRWSNEMLIESKNTTFTEELTYKDKNYLVKLQTDIEKELLRLNENLSKMELNLQQKLVKNENVSVENSLIPLYQQRISIFEALLTSLKQVMSYK